MIVHIKASGEAALQIAEALRNSQIGQAKGGLLVKGNDPDAEPRYMVEKLILAKPLFDDDGDKRFKDASEVPWKPDGMVILVGDTLALLDAFEELVPGFRDHFGPVTTLTVA